MKYLRNDLDCLYEVISAYERRLSREYHIDVTKYLSQPSIALAVFRSKYLKESHRIPITRGHVDKYVRASYRGGHVEVYKPTIKKGYYYDVNSLYPACLLKDMPVGDCLYIYKPKLSDFFGFVKAKVKCPANLNRPFLGVKDDHGKLIYPTGEWTDIYFSETLKYAENLGYEIETVDGYKFERGVDIFKEYITDLYNKKQACENNNDVVGRTLYKLQANSFYGRFGMHEADPECTLVDYGEFENIACAYEIKSAAFLGSVGDDDPEITSKVLVEYLKQPDPDLCESDEQFTNLLEKTDKERRKRLISVGISAAVTSYAQIHMYQFTSRTDAVYTDTDSVCLQNPLPPDVVNNKIGSMKLEATVLEGMFIKPKVYYMETEKKLIMKFKGIPGNLVKKDDYLTLYRGQPCTYKTTRMYKDKVNGIVCKDITISINPPDDTKRIRIYESGN